MIYGLDVLAAAQYRKRAAKFSFCAAGIFWRTFGNAKKAVRLLAKNCSHVRIQGVWKDDHRFRRRELKIAIKRGKQVAKLQAEFPNVKFYYSPFCEHRLSAEQAKRYLNKIAKQVPELTLVNTPDPVGDFVEGYINEVHHSLGRKKPPKPYFFSFDGADCLEEPVDLYKEKYSDAELFFFWTPRFNLKYYLTEKISRTRRILGRRWRAPDREIFRSVRKLAN